MTSVPPAPAAQGRILVVTHHLPVVPTLVSPSPRFAAGGRSNSVSLRAGEKAALIASLRNPTDFAEMLRAQLEHSQQHEQLDSHEQYNGQDSTREGNLAKLTPPMTPHRGNGTAGADACAGAAGPRMHTVAMSSSSAESSPISPKQPIVSNMISGMALANGGVEVSPAGKITGEGLSGLPHATTDPTRENNSKSSSASPSKIGGGGLISNGGLQQISRNAGGSGASSPMSDGASSVVLHRSTSPANDVADVGSATSSVAHSTCGSAGPSSPTRHKRHRSTNSIALTMSKRINWKFVPRRGHSALYSGIRSLAPHDQVIHIGWTGPCFDDEGHVLDITSFQSAEYRDALTYQLAEELKYVPIYLNDKMSLGHYEGYCKSDLWPLFHYIVWGHSTNGAKERKNWADYIAVNRAFADAIIRTYKAGDVVWVHDYHLFILPAMIREAIPDATIGFFLHTPFPSSEIFRCLPTRKEVLQGILGANLIGFQTYSYARHFISSCTRVLGLESTPSGLEYGSMQIKVGIFPIGIDVGRVERRRKTLGVAPKLAAIREMYPDKKIIIGRDKLDHIKGVEHKLNAFEKFLTMFPEWQNKVVLIQVTSPTLRPSSLHLDSKVSELVSRINGAFGSLEFAPVHHYHQHLDQDEYYALLSAADVGLITSVRDGMNTTSHEFVVCQHENQGVLILSEFTGTAGSLSAALIVNPFDYVGVAMAIKEALEMSREEKFNKHQQLYDHVTRHTAQFWSRSFVKELGASNVNLEAANPTPALEAKPFLEDYRKASGRLLLFDYDGTLTPIRKVPNAAIPTPDMLSALATLAADPKNYVFVISGRDQATLEEWLGHIPRLGMSAEHGCFIKCPEEDSQWINLSEELDLSWKNDVADIFNFYTERTQGSFVEHKRCSITWHYRLADPDYGLFQAKECQNHLENAIVSKLPVEVLVGKKNLEVRPISINKGEIVKRLMLQKKEWADFVFCVGDDKTDEDMFKMLKKCDVVFEENVWTCTIGSATKFTQAGWHVSSPEDVIRMLGEMAKISVADGVEAPSEDVYRLRKKNDA